MGRDQKQKDWGVTTNTVSLSVAIQVNFIHQNNHQPTERPFDSVRHPALAVRNLAEPHLQKPVKQIAGSQSVNRRHQ